MKSNHIFSEPQKWASLNAIPTSKFPICLSQKNSIGKKNTRYIFFFLFSHKSKILTMILSSVVSLSYPEKLKWKRIQVFITGKICYSLVGGLDVRHLCSNNNNPIFWVRVSDIDLLPLLSSSKGLTSQTFNVATNGWKCIPSLSDWPNMISLVVDKLCLTNPCWTYVKKKNEDWAKPIMNH